MQLLLVLVFVLFGLAVLSADWWTGTRPEQSPDAAMEPSSAAVDASLIQTELDRLERDRLEAIPGIEAQEFNRSLAPLMAKADPANDDWDSEQFSAAASKQLKQLEKLVAPPSKLTVGDLEPLVTADLSTTTLRPEPLEDVFSDGAIIVRRPRSALLDENRLTEKLAIGPTPFIEFVRALHAPLSGATDHRATFKIFRAEPGPGGVTTSVYFQASAKLGRSALQQNATWSCQWTDPASGQPPRLKSVAVTKYEEVVPGEAGGINFVDWTESVLGHTASFRHQLVYNMDHWRDFLPFDLTSIGNQGIAVGDADGDGLDDVYICQADGLPNRLYLRSPDGTLRDASDGSGTDWLDYSHAALFVDLDNDGDQDLVVTLNNLVLILANDGAGSYALSQGIPAKGTFMSAAAADYDVDGDLDLYICGYIRLRIAGRTADDLISPTPYHDANNGASNLLLRNDGELTFSNATVDSGLDENNSRFSFAASWEDFDNDGDLDLYVANDFGRNNLYRNERGRFRDISAEAGVEDISAGMGVTWGDYNNDGHMDLYVSNMFSSAGGRVSYQRRFREDDSSEALAAYRRHARGNTLFDNQGDGTLADVSVAAGVTMGRWAWGAKFADLNNDGLQDLYVANGFLTSTTADDL